MKNQIQTRYTVFFIYSMMTLFSAQVMAKPSAIADTSKELKQRHLISCQPFKKGKPQTPKNYADYTMGPASISYPRFKAFSKKVSKNKTKSSEKKLHASGASADIAFIGLASAFIKIAQTGCNHETFKRNQCKSFLNPHIIEASLEDGVLTVKTSDKKTGKINTLKVNSIFFDSGTLESFDNKGRRSTEWSLSPAGVRTYQSKAGDGSYAYFKENPDCSGHFKSRIDSQRSSESRWSSPLKENFELKYTRCCPKNGVVSCSSGSSSEW